MSCAGSPPARPRPQSQADLQRFLPIGLTFLVVIVMNAEARERLPALRAPARRLLERVQFLQSYLLGVCRRAERAGRRGDAVTWRSWWSPSRGLAEVGFRATAAPTAIVSVPRSGL